MFRHFLKDPPGPLTLKISSALENNKEAFKAGHKRFRGYTADYATCHCIIIISSAKIFQRPKFSSFGAREQTGKLQRTV